MSEKRKISIRKIIQAVLTLVLAGACITAVMSATKLHDKRTLSGVDIDIRNSAYGFVTEEEIEQTLLRDGELGIDKTALPDINVQQMETVLLGNPYLRSAQVYIDNNAVLHAQVTQRVPLVRIFDKNGNTYYIDQHKEIMPRSLTYAHYSMVVTNAPDLGMDTTGAIKEQILKVVNHIKQDTFWNAQVSQVIVGDDMKFEIVPVLGNQRVIIGDTSNLDKKFDNLFTFYKKVLNKVGWDRYEMLDLSYNGQLVASPAIDWKLPQDKAIRHINWVKTILGDDIEYAALNNNKPKHTAKPVRVKEQDINAENTEQTNINSAPDVEVRKQVSTPAPKENKTQQKAQPVKPEAKKQEVKNEDKKPKYIYGGNGD